MFKYFKEQTIHRDHSLHLPPFVLNIDDCNETLKGKNINLSKNINRVRYFTKKEKRKIMVF